MHIFAGRDDERKRKRKSRWQGDEKEKIFIPGMPTVLPPNLSKDQEEAYLCEYLNNIYSYRFRSLHLNFLDNVTVIFSTKCSHQLYKTIFYLTIGCLFCDVAGVQDSA